MAIKEVRREWDEGQLDFVKEFILHKEADVADLPVCSVGSTAYVGETNNVYVCCRDGGWKLREEAIEEDPGEGGGEYTPPDWGSKRADGYLMPETTLTVDPESEAALYVPVIDIVAGEQYTVKWNGTDYVCTATEIEMEGLAVVALGNHGALTGGEATSEPFVILALTAEQSATMGTGAMVIPFDGSMSPAVSIYGGMEIVQKIEEKYVPFSGFPTINLMEYGMTEMVTRGVPKTVQLTEEQTQEVDKAFEAGAFWCITGGIDDINETAGAKVLLHVGVSRGADTAFAYATIEVGGTYANFLQATHAKGGHSISVSIVHVRPGG